MSTNGDDVRRSSTSLLKNEGAEEATSQCEPVGGATSSSVARNTGPRDTGLFLTADEGQRELFELMALMRVPLREIIDLDERSGYESFLAAKRRAEWAS